MFREVSIFNYQFPDATTWPLDASAWTPNTVGPDPNAQWFAPNIIKAVNTSNLSGDITFISNQRYSRVGMVMKLRVLSIVPQLPGATACGFGFYTLDDLGLYRGGYGAYVEYTDAVSAFQLNVVAWNGSFNVTLPVVLTGDDLFEMRQEITGPNQVTVTVLQNGVQVSQQVDNAATTGDNLRFALELYNRKLNDVSSFGDFSGSTIEGTSNQFPPDEVSAALVSALNGIATLDGQKAYVDNVTESNLADDDTVASKRLPCVMFMYAGTDYVPAKDITRCTYNVRLKYSALVGFRSLKGQKEESLGAQKFLAVVKDALTGLRLVLQDGKKTEPITLENDELLDMTDDGTWYQLDFGVGGIAQFTQKL